MQSSEPLERRTRDAVSVRGPAPSRRWTMLLAAGLLLVAPPATDGARNPDAASPCSRSSSRRATRSACVVRVPLEAMRDVKFPLHGPGYLDIADRRRRCCRDAAQDLDRQRRRILRGRHAARGRAGSSPPASSLPSDRSFESYDSAVAHVDRRAAPGERRSSRGSRRCSTSLLDYPHHVGPARASRSIPRWRGWAFARTRSCGSFRPAARARVRVHRRSRASSASIRAGTRRAGASSQLGLRAHPRRHRPPAVHLLPRHSVPAHPAARRDHHVVHGRRTRSR